MKKKKLTKPVFALVLLFGALSWGGCGDPCEFGDRCPQTSTTIYGPDTIYYPYVRDFDANGKIYTYQIKLPYGTFTRSYKMTEFKHHSKIELAPLLSENCDPSTSCDTFITRWYVMDCEDIDGNGGVGFVTEGNSSFKFVFYDKLLVENIIEGYPLHLNFQKTDTTFDDQNLVIKWYPELNFHKSNYSNVTSMLKRDENQDTVWLDLYN